jgi:hypothetical protein
MLQCESVEHNNGCDSLSAISGNLSSHATVVAHLPLFVALGGSSYTVPHLDAVAI